MLKDCAICYANRAFCNIKLEQFGSAVIDATRGIEVDPTYAKSYYRLGSAKYALSRWKEAKKAFTSLCKLAPSDKDARLKLKECEKVRRCRCSLLGLALARSGSLFRLSFSSKSNYFYYMYIWLQRCMFCIKIKVLVTFVIQVTHCQ